VPAAADADGGRSWSSPAQALARDGNIGKSFERQSPKAESVGQLKAMCRRHGIAVMKDNKKVYLVDALVR
jgi:hypothetical protein